MQTWSTQPAGSGGLLFIVYYSFINSRNIFFCKVLNISGNINSFLYRKSVFLLLTSVVRFGGLRCRHFYDTLFHRHTMPGDCHRLQQL